MRLQAVPPAFWHETSAANIIDGNNNVVGYIQNSIVWGNGFATLRFIRVDGTSEQNDILQAIQLNTPPPQIINNNPIINNNYYTTNNYGSQNNKTPSPSHKLSNATPSQKTPVLNDNFTKPSKVVKEQKYQFPDGEIITVSQLDNNTLSISSNKNNSNLANNSNVDNALKNFLNTNNDFSQNNQINSKNQTTRIPYQKTVDNEVISANNQSSVISIQAPYQENIPVKIYPNQIEQNLTKTDNYKQVNQVPSQIEQNRVNQDFNNLINKPSEQPVNTPQSWQEFQQQSLLFNEQVMLSLATVASVSYIAQQFAQTNQNIANIPNQIQPSPCSWPNDRTQIINTTEQTRSNTETANTTLGVITNTQLVGINSTVNTINSGVTGLVNTIGTATSTATNTLFGFATQAYRSLYLDRVYNALSILMQIHNTAMLSRNVGESIGYLLSSSLALFGIKDENGSPLDFEEILGNSIQNFLKGFMGENLYNGIGTQFKRLSTIYNAAVNIYDLLLTNLAGIAQGLEIVGEYSGKIGNALKRGGVILYDAYNWMDENIQIKTGRLGFFERVDQQLQDIEDIADNFTQVTDNIHNIGYSYNEIKEELDNVKSVMNENVTNKETLENEATENSQSPNLTDNDLIL